MAYGLGEWGTDGPLVRSVRAVAEPFAASGRHPARPSHWATTARSSIMSAAGTEDHETYLEIIGPNPDRSPHRRLT